MVYDPQKNILKSFYICLYILAKKFFLFHFNLRKIEIFVGITFLSMQLQLT